MQRPLPTTWALGDMDPTFKRLFMSFDTQRRGFFKGYRLVIGINDCHLRGIFKEVLLAVVAIDCNYGIYPIGDIC